MRILKGYYTCFKCNKKFWDEVPMPDEANGCISFCPECGRSMGFGK